MPEDARQRTTSAGCRASSTRATTSATSSGRTPPEDAWTLAAYARYAREVRPEEVADVVARVDDARHPAMVVR